SPPLDHGCSEQSKLPTAKAFKLAERDKFMSEQKSFMQQLDEWTEATVIMPLAEPTQEGDFDFAVDQVKKAIRDKVLQSYRNGQRAGPRKFTGSMAPPARYQPSWRRPQSGLGCQILRSMWSR